MKVSSLFLFLALESLVSAYPKGAKDGAKSKKIAAPKSKGAKSGKQGVDLPQELDANYPSVTDNLISDLEVPLPDREERAISNNLKKLIGIPKCGPRGPEMLSGDSAGGCGPDSSEIEIIESTGIDNSLDISSPAGMAGLKIINPARF